MGDMSHDDWRVSGGMQGPTGIPFVGAISPRGHVRLEDAPLEVLAERGGKAFPAR